MAAAATPNLIVVGSDYTAIGDGSNYHLPIMVYNLPQKRVEGHYLTVGAGASGTLSMGATPLGTAFNVYSNVIATLGYISGGLSVSLFNTDTMETTGAAFSNSAADFAGALKHTAYATATLTDANVTDASNAFVLPYTNSHFLVVTPQRCWRIRLSDGGIQNQFAIDPGNASYSRLNSFSATASVVPPPMPTTSGKVIIYTSNARNAADSGNVSVNALIAFNPITGVTTSSNYSLTGVNNQPGSIIPMGDGTFFTTRANTELYYSSDDVNSFVRDYGFGSPPSSWTYTSVPAPPTSPNPYAYWMFLKPSAVHPYRYEVLSTVSNSGSVTQITGQQTSSFSNDYKHVLLFWVSATQYLLRRSTGDTTGASIGSYISIREQSDGSLSSGYSEQQMIDHYSGNAVTGTGFNNKTFARVALGNMPDNGLYTVREVLGLMETPTPVGSVTCKVYDGTTWVTAVPKIYDGSAWVTAVPKVYNGSGWDG